MNVVVLNRKSLGSRPLQEWLDDSRARVCLVTTRAALDAGPPGIADEFRAVEVVDDYLTWEVELRALRLAEEHAAERIASSSEDDVVRAARLRNRLGLDGQGLTSALAFRDKVRMKEYAAAAGVSTPAFAAVDTPADLARFAAEVGFPLVLKPRRGAGSEGVRFVHDEDDLLRVLSAPLIPAAPARDGHWMVEEFVDAPFFHIDGVIAAGRVLHCWPSAYSEGNATSVRDRTPLHSVLLDRDDPRLDVLQRHAADVVAALPASPFPTSFHLEAWLRPGSAPILCEIACRTGGGFVADVYERAFGVVLPRESLRGQCGSPPTLTGQPTAPSRPFGGVALTPLPGVFRPPDGPCPVPGTDLTYRMAAGATSPDVVHAGDGAAIAVVSGDGAAEVESRIRDVVSWWGASSSWT